MLDSVPSASSTHQRRTWLDVVYSNLSSRHLSRGERLLLGVICLCSLILLVALQHGRIFLGDEIGTLRYLKQTPTYILTHFRPLLTMNYFILFEKGVASLCGATDWRLTLLPIGAAIAVIPLTASLALKLTVQRAPPCSLPAWRRSTLTWSCLVRRFAPIHFWRHSVSWRSMNFSIGVSRRAGGAVCDVLLQCSSCYSHICKAFT